jgi:hypothetical protein
MSQPHLREGGHIVPDVPELIRLLKEEAKVI